jgi:hypothetical protein
MENYFKSAEFLLDVLVSIQDERVRHWKHCITVHEKTEPTDEIGLSRMDGILSTHQMMLETLKQRLILARMDSRRS